MSGHGLWYGFELLRLHLFAAQFELQPPAMRRVSRFTPDFQRANLCETGSETYHEVHVPHFLAVAQQGYQRGVTMDTGFVQCSHFAVRIMSCARTVQRERYRAIRQHRKFAI